MATREEPGAENSCRSERIDSLTTRNTMIVILKIFKGLHIFMFIISYNDVAGMKELDGSEKWANI